MSENNKTSIKSLKPGNDKTSTSSKSRSKKSSPSKDENVNILITNISPTKVSGDRIVPTSSRSKKPSIISDDKDNSSVESQSSPVKKTLIAENSSDEEELDIESIKRITRSRGIDDDEIIRLPSGRVLSPVKTPRNISEKSRVSQHILKSSSVKDVEHTMRNIDDDLVKSGYTRLETFVSRDRDSPSQKNAFLTIATNPVGDIVAIKLVSNGEMILNKSEITEVKELSGTTIPASVKISTTECAKSGTCGILFKCDNTYCQTDYGKTGEILERSFTKTMSPEGTYLKSKDNVTAIPVISLNDIEKNPKETIVKTRETIVKLQNNTKNENIKKFDKMILDSELISKKLKALRQKYEEMERFRVLEHHEALSQYEKFEKEKDKNLGNLSPIDMNSYKQLIDRLTFSNVTESELQNSICEFTSESLNEMEILMEKIENIYASLFVMSRLKYDTIISKKLQDSKKWGFSKEIDKMNNDEFLSKKWVSEKASKSDLILSRVLPNTL